MVSFKKPCAIFSLVLSFWFVSTCATSLLAADKDCLKNFNVDNISSSDAKAFPGWYLLAEYFQCRASVRNNINECNNLKPWDGYVKMCKETFNGYDVLLKEGKVTSAVKTDKGSNPTEVNNYFQKAISQADSSYCKNIRAQESKGYRDCVAITTGDRNLCDKNDIVCPDKASYVRMMQTGDSKSCGSIKDAKAKAACMGLSRDETICEENTGYKQFKNNYCK